MDVFVNNKQAGKLEQELCVGLGFCSMRERYDRLIHSMPRDLTEVVNEIFKAEGLNPEYADRRLWRSVRAKVVAAHHASAGQDV